MPNKCIFTQIYINADFSKGQYVDHISHNTLDNRKENLRVVENRNNLKHRKSRNSNNKSGYRNVCWSNGEMKWLVQLQVNGKNTMLGKFDDVHEAGKFAEEMRIIHYGKYAGRD
jgi:hypothetical protein